ncbi:MAG: hypothetical protein JXQ73_17590 [Phycisphaerae bacterium]|nr:hypothetical protein [Phycisphaerae bacterium]
MLKGDDLLKLVVLLTLLRPTLHARESTSRPSPPATESQAQWLVDCGRDYASRLRGRPTFEDLKIVLAIMTAAQRLDPNNPEPYRWQAELLADLDRPDEALAALHACAQRDPSDVTASLQWIGLSVANLQTVETREQFIRKQLAQATHQPFIACDAYRRLAEIALTRGDNAEARKLTEAAIELVPNDLAANDVALRVYTGPEDRPARVRAALALVTANPMRVDFVWQLAKLLDDLSLHRQAQPWYAYALEIDKVTHPGREPLAELLFDLARSQADGGDLEPALETAKEAVRVDPDYVRARLLMVHVLRKLDRGQDALAQIRAVGEHYAKLTEQVVKTPDPLLAAQMAWYYALYDKRPDEAMRFAKIAVDVPAPDDTARRAYGFAALAKNDLPEAERALKDLAATDQMAAVGLARVYLATKRAHLITAVLQNAARLRATGVAHDEIAQMLKTNGLSAPPAPQHQDVQDILAKVNRAPLTFYKEPAKSIRLTAAFDTKDLTVGQPWSVTFELANVTTFGLTLGQGRTISGKVLVLLDTAGDRDRRFDNGLLVELDRLPLLEPGNSVRLTQTIDVGTIRKEMTATPQATQQIRLTAILNPVRSPDGKWTHGLGGVTAPQAQASRAALNATQSEIKSQRDALSAGRPADVVRAARILASLIAEREEIQAGKLKYKAASVDATALTRSLLDTAVDKRHNPIVRARIIETFREVKLTNDIIKSLSAGLSDDDWLVRLMTVWLFAHKQGPAFARVAERLAQTDPDPLVRDLVAAYLTKWREAAPRKRP